MKILIALLPSLMILMTVSSSAEAAKSVHDFSMKSLQGETVDLSEYRGKVLLIVNTASRCGLTPQYEQLQAMYEKYKDQGLVVLGFPCNQFGGQEPGSATEIRQFCVQNYGVTFPMFSKIEVNGDGAAELYRFLKASRPLPEGSNDIRWNFEKFVIGKDGRVVARFSPRVRPDADELVNVIEEELAR